MASVLGPAVGKTARNPSVASVFGPAVGKTARNPSVASVFGPAVGKTARNPSVASHLGGLAAGEEAFAALEDVLEGLLEVARVPRVRDISQCAHVPASHRERHHMTYLTVGIVGDDAADPAEVGGIHIDDEVVARVVGAGELPRSLGGVEPHAVLRQAALRRGVDRVADFLGRDRRRLDVVQPIKPLGFNQRFQYELCHRTAAYIAVAYEKNPCHNAAKIAKKSVSLSRLR